MWTITADDDTVISFEDSTLVCDDARFDAWILGREVAAWSPVGPWAPVPPIDEGDAYIAALVFLNDHDLEVAAVEGHVPYVEDRLYPAGRDEVY